MRKGGEGGISFTLYNRAWSRSLERRGKGGERKSTPLILLSALSSAIELREFTEREGEERGEKGESPSRLPFHH